MQIVRQPDRGRGIVKILLVGSTGDIGSAVDKALTERGHTVLGAGRSNPERPVELSDPDSIARVLTGVGQVDAIACAAGHAAYGRVSELTCQQYLASFISK